MRTMLKGKGKEKAWDENSFYFLWKTESLSLGRDRNVFALDLNGLWNAYRTTTFDLISTKTDFGVNTHNYGSFDLELWNKHIAFECLLELIFRLSRLAYFFRISIETTHDTFKMTSLTYATSSGLHIENTQLTQHVFNLVRVKPKKCTIRPPISNALSSAWCTVK